MYDLMTKHLPSSLPPPRILSFKEKMRLFLRNPTFGLCMRQYLPEWRSVMRKRIGIFLGPLYWTHTVFSSSFNQPSYLYLFTMYSVFCYGFNGILICVSAYVCNIKNVLVYYIGYSSVFSILMGKFNYNQCAVAAAAFILKSTEISVYFYSVSRIGLRR